MAKSFPNEEKDAWDVKMLLEVGHVLHSSFNILHIHVSILVKEHGRNLNVFEHLIRHNGPSLEMDMNHHYVDFYTVLYLRSQT